MKLTGLRTLMVVMCLSLTPSLFAQSLQQGVMTVSYGYGFPNLESRVFSIYKTMPDYHNSNIGPFYFKYEYCVADNIGVGLVAALTHNKVTYMDGYNDEIITRLSYSVLARFNYHFGNSDSFDPYVGIGVGYKGNDWTEEPNFVGLTEPEITLGMEATVGARYFFGGGGTGLYAEVGFAKSPVQIGLVFRFN